MTTFPKGEEAWTHRQVDALLRIVEDMFHRRDVEALVKGFTEDCIVRFSEQPERRGREALRHFSAFSATTGGTTSISRPTT